MPGLDSSVVAKIEAVCEEALAAAVVDGAPCSVTLDAWRAAVEADMGEALYKDRRAANEAADRPRLVMDEVKQEVLARRQEDMLALIRASPAWGYEQGSIGKTGNMRIHDSSAAAAGSSEIVHDHTAVGTSAVDALGPRMDQVLAKVGGDTAEPYQRWRERYIVLTPGTLECYRKGDGSEASGTPRASAARRGGMAGLERTLSRKLADVVSVKPHTVRTSAALLFASSREGGAEEAEPSAFFEVTFRNLQDSFKMDVLCIRADSPAEADAWITKINELRIGAVEEDAAEEEQRTQRLLDELEEAFNELHSALAPWLEKKALFPAALRVEERACHVLNETLCEVFAAKQKKLRGEPQSSAMWDIKPKYQSDTGWNDAIAALNRMMEDEEGQHLPTSLEKHMLAAIDSIYATHRAKHGREVPLGADELFPIFVYVLINSEVSQIPTFIEMMSRNLDQASKGAYYSITGYAAVQFINNQLDLPGADQRDEGDEAVRSSTQVQEAGQHAELEPEPEPQPPDGLGMTIRTISEEEVVDGDSFYMDVDSERLGCSGRMSCNFSGRRIEIRRAAADAKPMLLDLDLVRVILTFTPQRAFMLQIDGKLSCFIVEDPALYDHILTRVRYCVADALLESPRSSPGVKESGALRASGALRTSLMGPGGLETKHSLPAMLENLVEGTVVEVYSRQADDWVGAEVLSVGGGEVTVREFDTSEMHKNISLSQKVKGGFSVIRFPERTPGMTRHRDKQSDMVKLIFLVSDRDGDNYLNHSDCVALAQATEGAGATMTEADYLVYCQKVRADPAVGLTEPHLLKVYCELNLGNLDQDWVKMGLNQPLRSLIMQVTSNDTVRADLEKVRILQQRAKIARPAEARQFALVLAARLQEDHIPVKLKTVSILDTLLEIGTVDLMEAVRAVCHSSVKDALWFGQQDASMANPGRPAAMIREKAQSIDLKLSVRRGAAMSPIARSSILRGAFMMADAEQQNENEDIDLYLSLVMSWMEMSDSEQEEWRAAHGTSARWELIRQHMNVLDFDHELFMHDLCKQIFTELKGVDGAAGVARRLAFSMSCDEQDLRHQTVAEAVASELHVEVQEADSAYEDGTKQFTQYRMEFTLYSSSWSMDTRWSELLSLEKHIRDAFIGRPDVQRDLPTLKEQTKAAKASAGRGRGKRRMSISVGSSLKAIVRKTDESLIETRKYGVESYMKALCRHPNALSTVPFLDFVLPAAKDEIVDLKDPWPRGLDDDSAGQAGGDKELPAPLAWDSQWLSAEDVPFWEDEDAMDDAMDEDRERDVEQSTLNDLVAMVTKVNLRQEVTGTDELVRDAFFASFRAFTDSRTLLAKLWQRSMVPEAEGLDDLAADHHHPPNPADVSPVSRLFSMKYKVDEAADRLPMSMGRPVAFPKYCEIKKQKICTRVFVFLHFWVTEYYLEDFVNDLVLQAMLHGFTIWLREQKFSEESRRLMDAWVTQRKIHKGIAQKLRNSTMEFQGRVSSPKDSHKGGKKQPPPPPMLPAGEHQNLQVKTTRHNEKAMLKHRQFMSIVRSGGFPTAAQWIDAQLWHTSYTAELAAFGTLRATGNSRTSEASMRPIEFFDVPAEEIARQLTLIDYTYFSQVSPQDMAGAGWLGSGSDAATPTTGPKGINVVVALCWAIDVTQWVMSTVVTPVSSSERKHRLNAWVQVWTNLHAQNSYNLCFSVARGVLHPLIYAMPEFAALAKDSARELQNMTEFVDPGPLYKFKTYQDALKADMAANLPVLPYFALHLERIVHNNRLERIRKHDEEAAQAMAQDPRHSQLVGDKARKIFQDAFYAMIAKLPDREVGALLRFGWETGQSASRSAHLASSVCDDVVCCMSHHQATMAGTKRRDLAELRDNIQVVADDVARTSVGASPQEVRRFDVMRSA